MSFILGSLDFIITRFVGAGPFRKKKSFDIIPNDVIVDLIFDYLDVIDIIRVRQVSKRYYYLTHHRIIWNRLLLRYEGRIPPLPPTYRHSHSMIRPIEAERLLTRALSLEKTWNMKVPKPIDDWSFDAHHIITQMVLLPGSHYLVASVCDRGYDNWAIVVYAMDHRYGGGVALAKVPTHTKAYHLQARYLTIRENQSIAISYVRRIHVRKDPHEPPFDVSKYSGDHDVEPEVPVKYECNAFDISLIDLENLADCPYYPGSPEFLNFARRQAPPFRRIAQITSKHKLGPIALDEIVTTPYLVVVKQPNKIIFKVLDGEKQPSTLTCTDTAEGFGAPHSIMAIRMLPFQGEVLVVRRIDYMPHQSNIGHVIETYPILFCEFQRVEEEIGALDRRFMQGFKLLSVHITDHGIPFNDDHSVIPRVRRNAFRELDEKEVPFPITILCRTDSLDFHYYRITIFPVPIYGEYLSFIRGKPSFVPAYCLTNHHITAWRVPDENTEYRAIPGALRCFVYEVDWNDRKNEQTILSLKCWRELWHNSPAEEYQQFADKTHPLYDDRQAMEGRGLHRIGMSPYDEFDLYAHAYDETTGRLCLSSNTWVRVLDFAKAPKRDGNGERMPLPVSSIDRDKKAIFFRRKECDEWDDIHVPRLDSPRPPTPLISTANHSGDLDFMGPLLYW